MNNLNDIALKLAQITGKPVTDFIKNQDINNCDCGDYWDSNGVCNAEQNTEQEQARETKNYESDGISSNSREIRDNEPDTCFTDSIEDQQGETLSLVISKYGGKIVNGKLLNTTKIMTRKDYLLEKKKFKTVEEFWQSPLIYVMFRSEEQLDFHFVNWSTSIEMEILKRENKR